MDEEDQKCKVAYCSDRYTENRDKQFCTALREWYRLSGRRNTRNYLTFSTSVGYCCSSCWLFKIPATCQCISRKDLFRQLCVLTHRDRSCRSNCLAQSQYTDTGPTSRSADPLRPAARQPLYGSIVFLLHWRRILYCSAPKEVCLKETVPADRKAKHQKLINLLCGRGLFPVSCC